MPASAVSVPEEDAGEPDRNDDEETREARLSRWLRARAGVDRGQPLDPWVRECGRTMEQGFSYDQWGELLEQVRTMGPLFLLAEMQRYAAPPSRPVGPAPAPGTPDFESTSFLNAAVTWRGAVVRTILDRHGDVVSAEVVSPSGSATLDRAALARAWLAAMATPPPGRMFGEADRIALEWRFEAGDVAVPSIRLSDNGAGMQGGCIADMDDLMNGRAQCAFVHGYVRTRVVPLGAVAVPSRARPASPSEPPVSDGSESLGSRPRRHPSSDDRVGRETEAPEPPASPATLPSCASPSSC